MKKTHNVNSHRDYTDFFEESSGYWYLNPLFALAETCSAILGPFSVINAINIEQRTREKHKSSVLKSDVLEKQMEFIWKLGSHE